MEHKFITRKVTLQEKVDDMKCLLHDQASAGFAPGMTLRTPRRRISPRAKRRYRAIKDFLRRALGSSSQPDIKINSSIAINVSDLKHKIVGIEQQLTEVNKHYRGLICPESSCTKESQTLVLAENTHDLSSLKEEETDISSTKKVHVPRHDTRLLYKTSESHYRKSDDSDSIEKVLNATKRKDIRRSEDMAAPDNIREKKMKKKKSKLDNRLNPLDGSYPNLRKHKARSAYEHFEPSYVATTSYHSLNEPRIRRHRAEYPSRHIEEEYAPQHQYVKSNTKGARVKKQSTRNTGSPERFQERYESRHRRKSRRNAPRDLNEDFIADIIKRQYRPIRMFGKQESEISQFSAPVCRDQEYPIRENILEGSELCSCCFDGRRKSRYEYENDLSDMRSICDTRLYSTKRRPGHSHHRRHVDIYNNSEQYDLVPVKEKSSPKTRRKFAADVMNPYGYKEVPPSPRTHRPRLNLKAQYYTEFEEYMLQKRLRNGSPKRMKKKLITPNHCENHESFNIIAINNESRKARVAKKTQNETHIQQDVATMSSLPSPVYINEPDNITQESTLNKTQETDSSNDKSEKALSEIKVILQNFLHDLKKETVSQCDHSDINAKVGDKSLNKFRQDSGKFNASVMPNSGHSVNNYSVPQCNIPTPFMPTFPNPCCYPILPVCPMPNCMQSSYMMPSPSYTCASCANNTKENAYHKTTSVPNESTNNIKNSSETDQLIKEIYKFVAQSPLSNRRQEFREQAKNASPKERSGRMTTRSVGGSSKMSRHDAQVETQKIKCQSKSCEAIGSRYLSDTTYITKTNPSYSDTILERLSLEAATGSDSEYSSKTTTAKESKTNKFAKVLRSFGLFKKKKDVIEELSESESTVEVEVKAKKPPFRQELMNYMVHEQEYFNRPPPHAPYEPPPEYRHGYACHAGCPDHLHHVNPMQNPYHNCPSPKIERRNQAYRSAHRPSAPPYPNPYEGHHSHYQPQVPLCLKEVEVQSIGTQSDRKKTLFSKFTKKTQGPSYPVSTRANIQNCSTQTAKDKPTLFNWKGQLEKAKQQAGAQSATQPKEKPGLWSWKTLQAKVNQLDDPNTMGYSYQTQKKLAHGDIKMRNAMLKKLFYKRNPFSPRNLIVRTILGKDKSSYGEPPMMYRPRMFF